jgi:hypothetical protein
MFVYVCVCVCVCVSMHMHVLVCVCESDPVVYEVGVTSRGITLVLKFVNIGQIFVQITFIVM